MNRSGHPGGQRTAGGFNSRATESNEQRRWLLALAFACNPWVWVAPQ